MYTTGMKCKFAAHLYCSQLGRQQQNNCVAITADCCCGNETNSE